MSSPLLQCNDLCKEYQLGDKHTVVALQDVNVILEQGTWLSIMGPSGSGKSTLLALLAGLDRPSSGEVRFKDRIISGANDVQLASYRKKDIGIIFQEYQLFEELSSLENVIMPLVVSDMRQKEQREKAMSLLEGVGLAERAAHLPRQLSGGERQRVAIARALAHNPAILFADEPTSNIDRKAADKVIELFRSFMDAGKSMIVVSHDEELGRFADTKLRMDCGRIVR